MKGFEAGVLPLITFAHVGGSILIVWTLSAPSLSARVFGPGCGIIGFLPSSSLLVLTIGSLGLVASIL